MAKSEKRAADQDAAVETAFVEGTLPEVDRRAYVDTQHVLESLPKGSRVVWTNDYTTEGEWAVQPGNSRNIGRADTLRRALQMVNAHMVPTGTGTFIYVDADGNPLEDIELPDVPPEPPPV